MQQYPITSYSKNQDKLYQYSNRYTPNKYTDWHKKYQPKNKLDCQPDLNFQAQSILNQRNFQVTQRRYSQIDTPQPSVNQYQKFNQEIKSPFNSNSNFDFENYIRRLKIRLNQQP
ncbi:unnamed protein product [Paramecium sonneborni]|uniref:Uncharacterized protein n=1 Tax=Paramecium sonneborni TaxID=65129 RepID=A0A8S1R3F4_9CILI|nr:unnamed protein product [Paramecium sonneborni]